MLVPVIGVLLIVVCAASGALVHPYTTTCLRSSLLGNGCGPGRLEFDVSGSIAPKKLPRNELAPVTLEVHGKVGNEYGGHPGALREAMVNVDEGVAIHVEGLPSCALRKLENRDVAAAREACSDAIVGRGVAHVGFASSEGTARTALTVFNGGASDGLTRLYIHSAIAVPDATPLVGIVKIRTRSSGLETTLKLPPILEGDGSVLDFRFTVGRRFVAHGTKQSYVSGSCSDGDIRVSLPRVLFRNEARAPGEATQTMLSGDLAVPCTAELEDPSHPYG